ncbi:hypothetical protein AB0C01_15495 [Micromonospora sp. NPDC048905]|uniref:hypothetical protein n=1 Tax=Micromonospora sp. NPDC048905 TaxID=3155494 RepID=UPI0033F6DA7F
MGMEARGQHGTNVHPTGSPADRLAAVGNQMIDIPGEDAGAFRLLAEQVPELRPVIANLSTDHEVVAGVLERVEARQRLTAEPIAAGCSASGTGSGSRS